MRVTVIDPPAYTPPYDHSLCSALARRGLEVELATSDFRHGPVPEPDGYERALRFYRLGNRSVPLKAVQHPFGMLRTARMARAEGPQVAHFQWLPVPRFDRHLIKRFERPRVLTAHELLPREGERARRAGVPALFEALDAVVAHTQHGCTRLVEELGIPASKVSVIPHGAFDYLTRLPKETPMDTAAGDLSDRRVVLAFGIVRPYKGVDLLIEAFRQAPRDAVLLVVGRPLTPIEPLRRLAEELGLGERVRFVPRFVPDSEVPAYFRRADLVVLPYRRAEQSGTLFTALAFGSPVLATAVGGMVELAAHGAVRLVPPGDARSLGAAIADLLGDVGARATLSEAALQAAAGPYSWDRAAELTEGLYRTLLEATE
jgi:glycosyltransferase involved in cell wall biosynthesis